MVEYRSSYPGSGPLQSCLLALALLASACDLGPRAADYEAEHHLFDRMRAARPVVEGEYPLGARSLELRFELRKVILQRPASVHAFDDVPSGRDARLLIAPALLPGAWEKTDGVGFQIRCHTTAGGRSLLLDLQVEQEGPEDEVWHDRALSLADCSSPTTTLELETTCGPARNCDRDWAVWGDPHVAYPETLRPRAERLILLISIDTLRVERLGLYGNQRATSPHLKRLAEDAVTFETAIAPSPWTIPSHATLLTATDPRVHGADASTTILDSLTPLPEVLRASGWQTGGFVDTPYLSSQHGFDRGFERFDDEAPVGDFRRGARITRERILRWLGSADERPAFVFWHIMDVHGPYGAGPPFGGHFRAVLPASEEPDPRMAHLRRLRVHEYLRLDRYSNLEDLVASYDEGVLAVDAVVGKLLDVLREADLYDDALIVVTSDHGESFLDHGVGVGHGLFNTDAVVKVPLIVKLPGNRLAGARASGMVGLIDVAPSILEVLGIDAPSSFQGASFLPRKARAVRSAPVVHGFSSNLQASFIRTRRMKYIEAAGVDAATVVRTHLKPRDAVAPELGPLLAEQLYDLERDPRELASILETVDDDTLRQLRELLQTYLGECLAHRQGRTPDVAPEISSEARERLRALGYVD